MPTFKPLDPNYFNAAPWSQRRSNWIMARSTTATEFEQAQVAVIAETLAKDELSLRCVLNIGADALLKFFTYDLESTGNPRPFPLAGEKHTVSETRGNVDDVVEFEALPRSSTSERSPSAVSRDLRPSRRSLDDTPREPKLR